LSDADASLVGDICNRLDGIPLAIELAAARVDAFGVRGVAAHLDDRFRLLTKGRRTALPRHRTLSATLDWSYGLLTEFEQTVLRRLAVFARGFTLHAAGAIVADATHSEIEIIDLVAELVVKSLVTADVGDPEPRLRLLETTRAYALDKLVESGERARLARRHAEYYRDLLATAAQDGAAAEDWPAAYAPEIDNIRAALEWAFAPGGDVAVGVAIAADSVPMWLDLSLLSECHVWEEKAVANLDAAGRGTRREMVLLAALGISLRFTTGITEEAHAGLTRALELAERFNDPDYQLRTLQVLITYHAWRGELSAALTFARRFEAFAAGVTEPSGPPTADRMLGISQFFLGDLANARSHLQRALARFPSASRHTDLLRFGLDQRVNALAYTSNILWLQGFPDQALQMAQTSACEARNLGHPVSLCAALVWGTRVGSATWMPPIAGQKSSTIRPKSTR
jgi:tetratricopeptide (TPR) repeat protein